MLADDEHPAEADGTPQFPQWNPAIDWADVEAAAGPGVEGQARALGSAFAASDVTISGPYQPSGPDDIRLAYRRMLADPEVRAAIDAVRGLQSVESAVVEAVERAVRQGSDVAVVNLRPLENGK